MKKQAFNPFLPSNEYIPDGEPRVFGDRVYLFGSHDRFNALIFCTNDYVCWSAPVNDLSDWKMEGVIYRKKQDPKNKSGLHLLFAPDVIQGPDERFYLYYAMDFMGIMGVAVSETPGGMYEFIGHIHYPDGKIWGRKKGDQFPFDPGVLVDDDGSVYLYAGFATKVPSILSGFYNLENSGGVMVELEQDMLTIKSEPTLLFPRKKMQGAYDGHAFFEASSIRKHNGVYYFIYSSEHNHELCYAAAQSPTGPFAYGGTLISIGDLFLNGNTDECRGKNYLGNTHGSIVKVEEEWYVFYHRHTNRHSYSRQACAEPIELLPDGRFKQAEITSCGLNKGPLKGKGKYEARIACNLWSQSGAGRYDVLLPRLRYREHPYFTQSGKDREDEPDQYIANMRDGAVAGFKYFELSSLKGIAIDVRVRRAGMMEISTDYEFKTSFAKIHITRCGKISRFQCSCSLVDGIYPLYFRCMNGNIDFYAFELVT